MDKDVKARHTPGPWGWYGSTINDGRFYLATTHSGRRTVMSFRRSGTQGATPEFQVDGRMVRAAELVRFDVDPTIMGKTAAKTAPSVYREDFSIIDHPDAQLIAAAPDMEDRGRALLEALDYAKDNDGICCIRWDDEAFVAFRAAIAKATGES